MPQNSSIPGVLEKLYRSPGLQAEKRERNSAEEVRAGPGPCRQGVRDGVEHPQDQATGKGVSRAYAMGYAGRGKRGPGTNRSAEDHGEKRGFTDRGGTVGGQQANRTADGGHIDPPSGPIRDVAGHRPSGQDRPEKRQPSQQGPPRGGMRVVGDKYDHHGDREPDAEAEKDTPQPAAKQSGQPLYPRN